MINNNPPFIVGQQQSSPSSKVTVHEALEVTGVKKDVLALSDRIQEQIHRVEKSLNLEKVSFDIRRSALGKAVLAVETSLYDRKVLEDDLLAWANKYSHGNQQHSFQSDANNNSHEGQNEEDDHEDDLFLDRDDEDDDDEDFYHSSDDENPAFVSNALSAPSGTLGEIMQAAGEGNRGVPRRSVSSELERFNVDSFLAMPSNVRRKKWKTAGQRGKHFLTKEQEESAVLLNTAAKRLKDHDEEEMLDPMYDLLRDKENQVGRATTALTAFSKRIIAMYRAFFKIYTNETGGGNASGGSNTNNNNNSGAGSISLQNAVAVKLFEAETLRQLHLMETATNAQQTQSMSVQQKTLEAIRKKNKVVDIVAMKKQITTMRQNLIDSNRTKAIQEDQLQEQKDRIAILEIACRELTKTAHQLRGDIRQFEEADARRNAARRALAGAGANISPSSTALGTLLNDENAFALLQSRQGSSRGESLSMNSDYYGNRRESYLNNNIPSFNENNFHQHHPQQKGVTWNSDQVDASRLKEVKKNNDELKRRLIRMGTSSSLSAGLQQQQQGNHDGYADDGDRNNNQKNSFNDLISSWNIDNSQDAETQVDLLRDFDEETRNLIFPSVGTQTSCLKNSNYRDGNDDDDNVDGEGRAKSAGKKKRPGSDKKKVGIRDLSHLSTNENETHSIHTDSHFFNNLADALTEDQRSIFLPKILRKLIQNLDGYLISDGNNNNINPHNMASSSSICLSDPLKNSILRVREFFAKEKVALAQLAARSGVTSPSQISSRYHGNSNRTSNYTGGALVVDDQDEDFFKNRRTEHDYSNVHVPRKPPAPSSSLHVSDSAKNSMLLPSETFQRVFLANNSTGDDRARKGIGDGSSTLHPHIDLKMAARYEDSIEQSRRNSNVVNSTSTSARPSTANSKRNPISNNNNNSVLSPRVPSSTAALPSHSTISILPSRRISGNAMNLVGTKANLEEKKK